MRRLLFVLLSVFAVACNAQTWPAKPVRFLLSQPPGTGPDIISRLVADKLTPLWNQQVIVENRAGGNNVIGAQAAAKMPPDGYNYFFATTAATVINLFTIKNLPYSPAKDFVPVALMAKSPFVLVVNPEVPAKNIAELVAHAKAQPGKLSFASDNVRGLAGMLGEMVNVFGGINVVHVPYQGSVQALTETVSGRTQYTFNSAPPVAPFVKSGKLRAIAVTGPERMPTMPDVPTVRETYPGFEYFGWYMLYAPTGAPSDTLQRVNRDMGQVMKDPQIGEKLTGFGSIVERSPGTPKELADFLRSEEERWGRAVKAAKIQPE
jgi:tripartite-type tricarboxylate transporter receptor subunit TctC